MLRTFTQKDEMTRTLDQVCAAILPAESLPVLGPLRACPGIRVALQDRVAVVRWDPGLEDVLRVLIAQPGVQLFETRSGLWYRPGSGLPAFEMSLALDSGAFQPLDRVLVPRPIQSEQARSFEAKPAQIRLRPDIHPRPTQALRTTLEALARWADHAPTADFQGLSAATSNNEILLVGHRLPPIPASERFWGKLVLVPLGWRPDPPLSEDAFRSALGVDASELLLVESDGIETIPLLAFEPLSRSSVRLAREAREA